jgi:ATP-dependent DNA helicase DinG
MAGGGSAYDDGVVRARIAQAFGRLIRRQGDCGLFVILSAAMPSRLLAAFPPGVPVSRVPLDQAIARVEQRLASGGAVRVKPSDEAADDPSARQVELGRS